MALPPLDPLCPPEELLERPSDCANKLPDLAERLLSAAWAGMRRYPSIADGCREMVTYVSFGEPESFFCDSLTVWLQELRVKDGFNQDSVSIGAATEAVFAVQLIESGWPIIDETANGASEPSVVVENEAAWYTTQHAVAMWSGIMQAINDETLFGVGNIDRVDIKLGPLVPGANLGGCVSWTTDVTIDIEAFV